MTEEQRQMLLQLLLTVKTRSWWQGFLKASLINYVANMDL